MLGKHFTTEPHPQPSTKMLGTLSHNVSNQGGSHYVSMAGFKVLDSSDPPASALQIAGKAGANMLDNLYLIKQTL